MILTVEAKQRDLKALEAKPAARLNLLQTEVIELFVELSRLLGARWRWMT
jgi:hypothetical protein